MSDDSQSTHARALTAAEQRVFRELIARLEARGLPAILLRNYEHFPAEMGHDLDLFVPRAQWPLALDCLRALLAEQGGEIVHIQPLDYVFAVWFRLSEPGAKPIHLDFYHGAFTWHGLPYLNERELVEQRRSFGEFHVPRPAHEALNLWLASLLWGSFLKERYRERILALLAEPGERAEFERIVGHQFGRTGLQVSQRLQACQDAGAWRQSAAALRRAFKLRSLRRHPVRSLSNWTRHWLCEISLMFAPPGLQLAILGPDGSGKSSVIARLKSELGDCFGDTLEYHWRPSVLPDVGVLFGRRAKTAGPTTDPHAKPPHSLPASLFRLVYYWLDYWLGWPFRIWRPKAKNHLVIFDRYAEDMGCDPRRFRLATSPRLAWFVARLVPRPNLTFVLLGDADVLLSRKAEVSLESLIKLLANYQHAAQLPRAQAVDCNQPLEEVVAAIRETVFDHLKQRAAAHPWMQRHGAPPRPASS